MAADSEISLLTRGSMPSGTTRQIWSSQANEEDEVGDKELDIPSVKFMSPESVVPSPQLRCFESELPSIHKVTAESRELQAAKAQLSLSFDTSQASVRSTDTTLEYFDAPLAEEQEGEEEESTAIVTNEEVVMTNINALAQIEVLEEEPLPTVGQTLVLTSEDQEREEETTGAEVINLVETGFEQEARNEEEVLYEKADEQDVESRSQQEDGAALDQDNLSENNQGNSIAGFTQFISPTYNS